MFARVFSPGKATQGRRLIAASLGLLLGVSALALSLVSRRSGDPFAARIHPPGWNISFQVPKRFRQSAVLSSEAEPPYVFTGATSKGVVMFLMVYRLTREVSADSALLCRRVLDELAETQREGGYVVLAESTPSHLGSRQASELQDARLGIAVRGLVLNPNEAYALALLVPRGEIDSEVYGLFDLMGQSVEFMVE